MYSRLTDHNTEMDGNPVVDIDGIPVVIRKGLSGFMQTFSVLLWEGSQHFGGHLALRRLIWD